MSCFLLPLEHDGQAWCFHMRHSLCPPLITMTAPRPQWEMCELLEASCNTASRSNPSVVRRPPPASPPLVYPSSTDKNYSHSHSVGGPNSSTISSSQKNLHIFVATHRRPLLQVELAPSLPSLVESLPSSAVNADSAATTRGASVPVASMGAVLVAGTSVSNPASPCIAA